MRQKRRNSGRFIISAGEVGQFVFCPESWKIRELGNYKEQKSQNSVIGTKMHEEWSEQLDYASNLAEGLRFLLALVITTIIIVVAY